MAVDILELHNGIVHQSPDTERKPSEGKDVEGFMGEVKEDESHQGGERDRDPDDEGGPKASQEEQDHDDGQNRSLNRFVVETLDRLANIGGLVKKRVKVNARRNAPKVGNGLPNGVDHGHRVGARLLVDGKVDGILAVDAHHVGLGFGRVLHPGNVLDEDRHGPAIGSRLGRDRNITQDIHQVVADLCIREKIVVLAPDLDVP